MYLVGNIQSAVKNSRCHKIALFNIAQRNYKTSTYITVYDSIYKKI